MSANAKDDVVLADNTLQRIAEQARQLEADAARLEFLITDGAVVARTENLPEPRYRLEWPALGEWQSHWFPSARAAIDAAREDAAT